VSDHAGWAILVTVARDGRLLDRRRVELVDADLPKLPHHSEGQRLALDEAVALVARVTRSARAWATACLETLAAEVPMDIAGIALRACPPLPPTVAGRITDYRAMCVADWVMYRKALARAAARRGWTVTWYDARRVTPVAGAFGRPWTKDHKLAMAAALAARS
jgi:hypothetical protein